MSVSEPRHQATLVAVKSATDCTVRLENGEEVKASLDAESLRQAHGRIYGLDLGGRVEVIYDQQQKTARIVRINHGA
jgi:hypothetical protein